MLKFISFGSGSSGNAYLLYTENDSIIIDCGVGIRSMKKYMHSYGLNLSMIHHILITHDHADHIKSVGSISDSFNIPVYSTQAVHEGIAKNWCVKKKVSPNQVRYVEKGKHNKLAISLLLLLQCHTIAPTVLDIVCNAKVSLLRS